MSLVLPDQKCVDLANYFLPNSCNDRVWRLALALQEAVEDFAAGPDRKYECNCGFVGLRHTPECRSYPLTVEGGAAGYPPGGGDDDSDIW